VPRRHRKERQRFADGRQARFTVRSQDKVRKDGYRQTVDQKLRLHGWSDLVLRVDQPPAAGTHGPSLFALAQRFPILYKWFNVELSLSAARI
jgi:hypothetical protein